MTKARRMSLSEAMRQAGISGAELARRVDVSESAISYLVNGRRGPSLRLAQQIAAELGLTVDAIEWPEGATSTSGNGGSV